MMFRNYQPLPFAVLPQGVGYAQPTQPAPQAVTLDSPAADVMTDLTRVTAVTIDGGDRVDEAHQRMLQHGVRLLLVVDNERKVMGAITADDVLGEGPVQIAALQGIHRDEVLVRHVMTPCRALQVLNLDQVRSATVGHIVATLRLAGRQHTLVVDRSDTGDMRLRGIFSTTHISRQLGIPIQTSLRAGTFAEIEVQLMH
jgi:CBS-domain-containing membrane protein